MPSDDTQVSNQLAETFSIDNIDEDGRLTDPMPFFTTCEDSRRNGSFSPDELHRICKSILT
jgi:hypothetical protein